MPFSMEAAAERPLDRFFDQWIDGTALPKVRLTYRIDGTDVVLMAEQLGERFEVPLTIALQYADRRITVVFPVTGPRAEMRVALAGALRGVDVSRDDGTLVEVVRN